VGGRRIDDPLDPRRQLVERLALLRQIVVAVIGLANLIHDRQQQSAPRIRFAIDPDKIEEEQKFDGIFVLRTNTDLNPLEAMLCYKQLWTVEQTFRTAKHLFTVTFVMPGRDDD
jgi:hypothetical protein